MKYGSLQQDEVIIDLDDDLDIIAFPKDNEGDIENQIKNIELPLVETNNEIIHHEPQHNALASNADVDEFNINYTHYNARSSNRNYKPLFMTICRNTELTVPQMVILFIMCIFLEYFVLLIITR
tara:strand:- start:301 stop:672 length:372 start_codon:yes stop_codon:yes gene_type:complete